MNEILMKGTLALAIVLLILQTVRLQRRSRHIGAFFAKMGKQEKMATLGHLLAGIAHELRTPLGAVSCTLDTDRRAVAKMVEVMGDLEKEPLDAAARTRLEQGVKALGILQASDPVLDQALERIGQLIRQLRLAGRGDEEEPSPVGVNGLIEGTLVLLGHELKQDVEVDLRLQEVPEVDGWPGPLGQVFLNLILNAQQALTGPGTITVASESAGNEVTVTVSDTGPGLPDICRDQLFEPGWSTKSEDEGTGLGLFISRRIVEKHGGRITADNGPEGGAVFTVVLPVRTGDSGEAGS